MAIVFAAVATAQSVYAKILPPQPAKAPPHYCAKGFYLIPGIGACVSNETPIYEGSNFTWGEATRDGSRIPRDTWYDGRLFSAEDIAQNIIELAIELDRIREQFGNHPITINSWYRPPEVNSNTPGAATLSLHQLGLAADIVIYNHGAYGVYDRLDGEGWKGGLGRYYNRTHVDLRDRLDRQMARWDG